MAATIKTFRNIFITPSSSIEAMLKQSHTIRYRPASCSPLYWVRSEEGDMPMIASDRNITSYLCRYKDHLDKGHIQNYLSNILTKKFQKQRLRVNDEIKGFERLKLLRLFFLIF